MSDGFGQFIPLTLIVLVIWFLVSRNKAKKLGKPFERSIKDPKSELEKGKIYHAANSDVDSKLYDIGKSISRFFKKIPVDNVVKNIKDTGKKIKFPEPYKPENTKSTSEMSREELAAEVHKARKRKVFATPNQWIGGIIGIVGYVILKYITGNDEWWIMDIIVCFLLFFLPGAVFIGGFLDDR